MAVQGTKHFNPVFEDWRQYSALQILEIASMMQGIEPRVLSDFVDSNGDGLDLSEEIRMLSDAVLTGDLTGYSTTGSSASSEIKIAVAGLIPWLRTRGYKELASGLEPPTDALASEVSAMTSTAPIKNIPPSTKPVQRSSFQETAILEKILGRGLDPKLLPKNKPGKSGVKSQIKSDLGNKNEWSGKTVFNKAWERLSSDGRICYSSQASS